MQRRDFLKATAVLGSTMLSTNLSSGQQRVKPMRGSRSDVIIVGGGLGGVAAALGALRLGMRVVLTEETDWIGGQLTSQAVPPDEHRWIETHGCTASYRRLRTGIREYYRRFYPLTPEAHDTPHLNPGGGRVSRLCHEPRVALAVLHAMLAPYVSNHQLVILREHVPVGAEVDGDKVQAVYVTDLGGGKEIRLEAPWFVDATELGDLLPLCGVEHVTGAESKRETGELHAASEPQPENQQAVTACFIADYVPDEEHTIDPPAEYDFWRDYVPQLDPPWPGKLLDFTYTHPSTLKPRELGFAPVGHVGQGQMNLFEYRKIIEPRNFSEGTYAVSGATAVNWPQNDYFLGNLTGEGRNHHIQRAKQLSLSLLHWLQTEAPRSDGGNGWPGLRLRPDLVGTADGLAKGVYVRESRRIRSLFTVTEQHVGRENRAKLLEKPEAEVTAAEFADSVGVGFYNIDLHPSTGGDNYIDIPSLPFQIPLGALVPVRVTNLLPACKNLGTTHITNGCYRLHPVEWNIGESSGTLLAYCQQRQKAPHQVHEDQETRRDFQALLVKQGVELQWPQS